jgi:PAS domain S-box-containing protein
VYPPGEAQGRRQEIARRLWVIAIVAGAGFLLVASVIGLASYSAMQRQARPWIEGALTLSINARRSLLDHFIDSSRQVARQIAAQEPARGLLAAYERGEVDRERVTEASLPMLDAATRDWPALRGLVRLDAAGKVIVSLGLPPANATAAWTAEVAPEPMLGSGLPVLRMVTPISDENGVRLGTDLAFFGLHPVSASFQSDFGVDLGLRKRLGGLIDGVPTWLVPAGAEMDGADAGVIAEAVEAARRTGTSQVRRIVSGRWLKHVVAEPDGLVFALFLDQSAYLAEQRRDVVVNAVIVACLIVAGIALVMLVVRPLGRSLIRLATELERSERRLRLAQGAASIGTFEYDISADRIHATPELGALYGLTTASFPVALADWARLVHRDDRERTLERVQRAVRWDEDYEAEFRVLHEGRERWLYAKGMVTVNERGRRVLLGINLDIDRRRRAEEELAEANRGLEQFASMASHDLQEPLRMVTSYLGLLRRRYVATLDNKGQEYLGFAIDGAERMKRLIRDVLDFARIGRGSTTLVPTDAAAACADALRELRERIEASGAAVTVGDLPPVIGERAALARVFQNLISNAIKYHRPDVRPEVRISAEREGRHCVFAISDNGIGIPSEQRERVFAAFQRLHTREEFSGTGLGLAICRRVIEVFGGRIWIEPNTAVGSVVRFTLTVAETPPA